MSKKTQSAEEWVGAPRALEILKEVNGRKINANDLARLGLSERVRRRPIDGRTYEYNVNDLQETRIAERKRAALDDDTAKREAVRKEQEG